MNTLFAKLFVWFWLAMLAIAGLLVVAQRWWQPDEGLPSAAAMAEHGAVLEQLYADDGIGAARGYVHALSRREPLRFFLVDPRGRGLPAHHMPPPLRRALAEAATGHAPQTLTLHGAQLRTHPLDFGGRRFTLLAVAPPRTLALPWWGRLLIALTVTALLSLLLATHLSRPVRRVRAASRRLAAGDLSTRVPESARLGDEISALSGDFNRMAERLEVLVESRNRLLRDISHELRSPLARLQVALGLVARGADARAQAPLERMEREIERLDRLIGEVLALARLEAGTAQLRREPVDLAALLAELCDDARFEAEAVGKSVAYAATAAAVVEGDAALLHSAFDNLLRNAVRHTAPGTSVAVELDAGAGGATVRIADHGHGVPADALDRIFEPFVRLSDARERASGGHGIGLAIARRAVEAHGGTVTAANAPGGGLVMTVRL